MLEAESTAKCFKEGKGEEKRRVAHLGDVVRLVWRRLTSLTIQSNFSHSMNVCPEKLSLALPHKIASSALVIRQSSSNQSADSATIDQSKDFNSSLVSFEDCNNSHFIMLHRLPDCRSFFPHFRTVCVFNHFQFSPCILGLCSTQWLLSHN